MIKTILFTTIKSSVAVVSLFIAARIMGKKQISQLTFFDYIVGITIGSIAGDYAINPDINSLEELTAMAVFTLFTVVFSLVSMKWYGARIILDGEPVLLIQNGKIVERNLRKVKLTVNDLLEECRLKDIFDISEVAFGLLETSGRLSILKKASLQQPTLQDLGLSSAGGGLHTKLIVDGKILDNNLGALRKDRTWLLAELKKQNVANARDVLLCYADSSKKLHVDLKGSDPRHITPV